MTAAETPKVVCAEIAAARDVGATTCLARARPGKLGLVDSADHIAKLAGFRKLGRDWHAIDRGTAQAIAAAVLERDLAYNHPVLDRAKAAELAARFIALFEPAHYFTNGTLGPAHAENKRRDSKYHPITRATFDTGIVAVGRQLSGILWVEDED